MTFNNYFKTCDRNISFNVDIDKLKGGRIHLVTFSDEINVPCTKRNIETLLNMNDSEEKMIYLEDTTLSGKKSVQMVMINKIDNWNIVDYNIDSEEAMTEL